jgi:nickel transport protein
LLAAGLILASAGPALSHGVAWRQAPSDKTYTLRFMYSDQTPMAYSEVKVYSPENSGIEYQNSRTDARGWFAFVPDVPGEWSFATDDGMGHLSSGKLEIAFDAAAPGAAAAAAPDGAPAEPTGAMAYGGSSEPTAGRVGLGLSVTLNILFLALVLGKKPKARP